MQISRHWRLNAQRYRLEGFRYENGLTRVEDRRSDLETQVSLENAVTLQENNKTKATAA